MTTVRFGEYVKFVADERYLVSKRTVYAGTVAMVLSNYPEDGDVIKVITEHGDVLYVMAYRLSLEHDDEIDISTKAITMIRYEAWRCSHILKPKIAELDNLMTTTDDEDILERLAATKASIVDYLNRINDKHRKIIRLGEYDQEPLS